MNELSKQVPSMPTSSLMKQMPYDWCKADDNRNFCTAERNEENAESTEWIFWTIERRASYLFLVKISKGSMNFWPGSEKNCHQRLVRLFDTIFKKASSPNLNLRQVETFETF